MQVLPKDFYKVMCSFTVILRNAFFVILRSAATKDLIKILRVSSPDSVRAERVPLARSAAQNDIIFLYQGCQYSHCRSVIGKCISVSCAKLSYRIGRTHLKVENILLVK